jgi:hypothetical protein
MRVVWVALVALACTGGPDGSPKDSAKRADSVRPTAEQPREIYIDSVNGTNPLTVYGRARTFENTVQVRARDSRGREMMEVFTTSVGEMGHHNPYTARLWIVRDPGPTLTVEAFEYSAKDGSVRSLIAREVQSPAERKPVALLFSTGGNDCTGTREFTRWVPQTVAVARLLVEALVAGPDSAERAAGATSPFPQGSRVQSVVLRDGTLMVDFNERLQNVGGACAAMAIRESVTETLQRLPAVRRVAITAGGNEKPALQP